MSRFVANKLLSAMIMLASVMAPCSMVPTQALAQPYSLDQQQAVPDNPVMRAWMRRTSARIAQTAKRLATAGSRGNPVVQFLVERGGQVVSARIVLTSGSARLDGAAIAIIYMAGPFVPLPSSYHQQAIVLVQSMNFTSRRALP